MTDYSEWFEDERPDEAPLSPGGNARRAAMRSRLTAAVARRRRTRTGARAAAALAVMIAIVWAVLPSEGLDLPGPAPRQLANQQTTPPDRTRYADIATVRDDPTVVARLLVSRSLSRELFIDDDELLRRLRAAGRPTGLLRTADRFLLTSDVTDPLS